MQTLEEKMKDIIFSEIDKGEYKVFLFWSRATWNYRNNSDYDIWIFGKQRLEYTKYLRLKRLLNELPCLVDVVDFCMVDDDFKNLTLKKIIPWN
jgi:predicted nucleotidyltransferase